MNWAHLITTKPHSPLLVWFEMLEFASERKHGLHCASCEGAAGRAIDLLYQCLSAEERQPEEAFMRALPKFCQSCAARMSLIPTLRTNKEATILKEGWRSSAWQLARQCPGSDSSWALANGGECKPPEEGHLHNFVPGSCGVYED